MIRQPCISAGGGSDYTAFQVVSDITGIVEDESYVSVNYLNEGVYHRSEHVYVGEKRDCQKNSVSVEYCAATAYLPVEPIAAGGIMPIAAPPMDVGDARAVVSVESGVLYINLTRP